MSEQLGIIEIFELMIVVIIILLGVTGIIFVLDEDYIVVNSVSDQVSYLASVSKDDENTQIIINLPDKKINVKSSNNQITANIDDKDSSKTFIGHKEITSNNGQIIIS